jgi:phage-related protein (TIGR01555 family)
MRTNRRHRKRGIIRTDGWTNIIAGIASAKDKNRYTHSTMGIILPDDELESIYADDGLGSRIVKLLPDDMFREGWDYDFPDTEKREAKEIADAYNDVMETVSAVSKIKEGFYWSRLYGGAVILIGALDGQPLDAPLKPKRIRSIEYLRIIDRSYIEFSKICFQLDPEKPRYGMPEFYPISFVTPLGSTEIREVHYSRIIELQGSKVPAGATRLLSQEQRYWGLSVLQNVDEYLRIVGGSISSIGHLLYEFSVGKYKLTDLDEILSSQDGEERIKKRMQVMDTTRSVFNSMFFAKDDDFIRENVNFSGVPEVLYNIFMLVSACTGYPITRLFGVSPAGLNSTGVGDMRNYYDMVRSIQKSDAEPIIVRLVEIISEWKGIEEPYIKWHPLQQLTEKEQSEMEKIKADTESTKAATYQAYINAGIMEPYEARFLEFGDTLDKIPVPEDLLPEVQSVPADNPEGELPANENPDDNDKKGKENESNEDDLDKTIKGMDEKELMARIKELESRDELAEEEETELEKLQIRITEIKKGILEKGKGK